MIKAKFLTKIENIKKPTIISAIPTIGFSGKVCVDKLIELTNSKLVAQFDIEKIPIVFVTNGKIENPSVKIYHKKNDKDNILFITSDYQPPEASHPDFSDYLIRLFKKMDAKQMIVFGEIPQTSKKTREIRIELNNPKKLDTLNEKIPVMGFNASLVSAAFHNKIPINLILKEAKPNTVDLRFVKDNIADLSKKLKMKFNLLKFEKEYAKEIGKIKEISMNEQDILQKDKVGYIG
jgi:predicted ATP-grasp superfamily ATP-dependent carboligase